MSADFEKLGVFYLGRRHDLEAHRTEPEPVLYEANDLLTHALCVGMTGSGKTGLCIDLIEEAAIDGIPAILVDPKGDLANLLLTFPELRPEDFEPWVNAEDARQRGRSVADQAAVLAERWRKGLAEWGQDGGRIRRLREAADFAVYTPGSNAGLPVSILHSFVAPPASVVEDDELLRERVTTTVAGLLGLLGLDAEPTRSREAVFLGNVVQHAWTAGRDLDLGTLIQEIQTPSVTRIGVMEVDTYFPPKDRFALATALNGLLASPGFGAWLEGEPLDIQRLYYAPSGKPRVSIFSIAHLGEAERAFFVTLLLNQLLGWMRGQSGTASLRALFYLDEIFGYVPPVANPPTKQPLLTLLKQARAFGIGVVLATQNPVDLDYKGLANIGTWFVGRLQTDRDQRRVLDGLEGAAAAQGSAVDRPTLERTLAGLGSRVFLLHNVHEDGPAIFESRWCLSFLRGPMTRNEIRALTAARRMASGVEARPAMAPSVGATGREGGPVPPAIGGGVPARGADAGEATRPALPPAVPQFFVPVRGGGNPLRYRPMVLGAASVRFVDAKVGVDLARDVTWLTPVDDDPVPVDWAEAEEVSLDPRDLERAPTGAARFAPLPGAAGQAKNYAAWERDFVRAIQSTCRLRLLRSATLNQVSEVGESEGDFRVRLQQVAREQRDAQVARLRARYAPKLAAVTDRLRRAEQAVEREAGQARAAKLSSVLSLGTTLLGAFLGRKKLSASNVNRAGTTLRGMGRAVEQAGDVERATENVAAVRAQLADLEAQFAAEVSELERARDPLGEAFETIELRPSRTNTGVKLLALAWVPERCGDGGAWEPAW